MPKDIKKIKSKARYEISTIKVILKSCKTFAYNYLFMFLLVNKKVSLSQKNILVKETHLLNVETKQMQSFNKIINMFDSLAKQ